MIDEILVIEDEWDESAENEPISETLRHLDGLEWLDRALTDETEDEQC